MTKEQAIEVLHELDGSLYETQQVALNMAIKSLEQQPSDETIKYLECNDIDVQKFIKAMKRQPLQVHPNSTQLIFERMNRPTSDDCVSRAEVIDELNRLGRNAFKDDTDYDNFFAFVDSLPQVTPTRKVGKWIYDKASQNWRCSECNETPKTMGYVGTADFMAEHFRFCNHCGIEMVGAENE